MNQISKDAAALAFLATSMRDMIAMNGRCTVSSELLDLALGVRVKADTADHKLSIIRQFPGVFLDLLVKGDVKIDDSECFGILEGTIDRLEAFLNRNGWHCYAIDWKNATATFERRP